MESDKKNFNCADCGIMNCAKRTGSYPEFCPTAALTYKEIDDGDFITLIGP